MDLPRERLLILKVLELWTTAMTSQVSGVDQAAAGGATGLRRWTLSELYFNCHCCCCCYHDITEMIAVLGTCC